MRLTLFAALILAATVGAAITAHRHTNAAAGPPLPAAASTPMRVTPSPLVSPRLQEGHPHRAPCTDAHWKRYLRPAERWIDRHESGLNPASREPTTGAEEIGQMLPSTLANLGLTYSTSPCEQIRHQRIYKNERYGSWANAKAHWIQNGWW